MNPGGRTLGSSSHRTLGEDHYRPCVGWRCAKLYISLHISPFICSEMRWLWTLATLLDSCREKPASSWYCCSCKRPWLGCCFATSSVLPQWRWHRTWSNVRNAFNSTSYIVQFQLLGSWENLDVHLLNSLTCSMARYSLSHVLCASGWFEWLTIDPSSFCVASSPDRNFRES